MIIPNLYQETNVLSFFKAKPSCDDLDDMEAFEGDLHTISIPCDGSPQPVIKWTKDGGELNFKDGHFTQTQTGKKSVKIFEKHLRKNLLIIFDIEL